MNEVKVEEVSRDVRSLDRGKQNLTLTIASLKRLAMLSKGMKNEWFERLRDRSQWVGSIEETCCRAGVQRGDEFGARNL